MPVETRSMAGKDYRLHVPPDIPVKEFWSVIVYSNQTRSMLHTEMIMLSVLSGG